MNELRYNTIIRKSIFCYEKIINYEQFKIMIEYIATPTETNMSFEEFKIAIEKNIFYQMFYVLPYYHMVKDYNIIYNDLVKKIYNLNYPHRFKLIAINYVGQIENNVNNIINEINLFHDWMMEKRLRLENDSLEVLCILKMKKSDISFDNIPECIKEKYDYFI